MLLFFNLQEFIKKKKKKKKYRGKQRYKRAYIKSYPYFGLIGGKFRLQPNILLGEFLCEIKQFGFFDSRGGDFLFEVGIDLPHALQVRLPRFQLAF